MVSIKCIKNSKKNELKHAFFLTNFLQARKNLC